MKKFIIPAVVAITSAAMLTLVVCVRSSETSLKAVFMESVESLAREEVDENVTCKCQRFFGGKCKASNSGATCASGHNIHCWEHDGNC